MKINYFDYSLIPARFIENIKYYVEEGCPLGGFLEAVFSNDLWLATSRADDENLPLIPVYVKYIHNNTPFGCHGSPAIVKQWMESKRKEKEAKQ